ncbi:MAG: tRNA preQ1(34) S-adenosylmethionine ribosyltransferase-isomerase QueA [Fibrobacteres bacterium]|nr:tRNA preQ1(34) S-adenosylmethionine ribosyltransferase-isomerase QueA [Fibrobacterota bacterium]
MTGNAPSLRLSDYDFEVPPELIAQEPAPRGTSRMLVAPAGPPGSGLLDQHVADFPSHFREGDCLVLNDTRVLHARLRGTLKTGGGVEVLLLEESSATEISCTWEAMAKPGRKLTEGRRVGFPGGVEGVVRSILPEGSRTIEFNQDRPSFLEWLESNGQIPLPPYVRRAAGEADESDYQTRWARNPGAVAAPTAGLHLGDDQLSQLERRGVSLAYVTLHVGAGTFLPISTENALEHPMHEESWILPETTAEILARTREKGGRIVCVGTTALRTVETSYRQNGDRHRAGQGRTKLFVHPMDPPRSAQGLLTNFHWPRTTLVLLAAAWLGSPERWREVYEVALKRRYRLFSYGDCMLSFRK